MSPSKHDRFRSKMPTTCKHRWKPFGTPVTANGITRRVVRCSKCSLTKVEKTKAGAK